uniref:Uncharacterized protein n=1 Tax=Gasterosteus aculeatus TaxID=69293 RepID=G3Q213_GASAC
YLTLVLTYHAVNGSGPAYIQDMVKPYIPTRTLRSASAKLLVPPSLRAKHSTRSRLFAVRLPVSTIPSHPAFKREQTHKLLKTYTHTRAST